MGHMILPSLGEGIEKGTVVSVLVKEGDLIEEHQGVIEVETDKVTMEVPSVFSGIVKSIQVNQGDEIAVGAVILELETKDYEPEIVSSESETNETTESDVPAIVDKGEAILSRDDIGVENVLSPVLAHKTKSARGTRISPRVRKFARELNIDISTISSQTNLIQRDDIIRQVRNIEQQTDSDGTVTDFSKWGNTHIESMSGIMKATARNMSNSWKEIPHAWLQAEADITLLEDERKAMNSEHDLNISLTVFLIKAVSATLQQFPKFNSSIDISRDQIILKDYVNIGVAVDTTYGLFVPVIKNVDHMPLNQISMSLQELAASAKEKKLKMEDLEGGNFTISNLGGFGTTGIFPVILQPQVAILGVASYQIISGKKYLPLTIGFDHRVIDGADAGRFLQKLVQYLSKPIKMLV